MNPVVVPNPCFVCGLWKSDLVLIIRLRCGRDGGCPAPSVVSVAELFKVYIYRYKRKPVPN